MKTFLIQTINGEIQHDFSFQLVEAIRYNNWYNNESIYRYILGDDFNEDNDNVIPIGSVEFVLDYLSTRYHINGVKPLNIPEELMKSDFLKREARVHRTTEKTLYTGEEPIFIKDNSKIKGISGFVNKNEHYSAGEWLISEMVDIDSEWRAFVYKDELVGLQNYAGRFTCFPDVNLIKQMIRKYHGKNPCYTLDVGINVSKGTFLIECHDFFSCGLYGFRDNILLPRMFIATWNNLISR